MLVLSFLWSLTWRLLLAAGLYAGWMVLALTNGATNEDAKATVAVVVPICMAVLWAVWTYLPRTK